MVALLATAFILPSTPFQKADSRQFMGINLAMPDRITPYDRSSFNYGGETRESMLKRESLIPVTYHQDSGKISGGKWLDPYTGVTFYNANEVDIDHLVPLYEVHISGGAHWDADKKRAFANDISADGPLRITHRWTNRTPKSADDPSLYTPSWVPGRCQYLKDWLAIKRKWDLSIDPNEAFAIKQQMVGCG